MPRNRYTGRQNVKVETASAEDVVDGGVRGQLQAHRLRNVRFRLANRLRNKQQYPYPPWFDDKSNTRFVTSQAGWRGRRARGRGMPLYVVVQVSRPKSINGDASTCGTVCATAMASNVSLSLCACNVSMTGNGDSSVAERRLRFDCDP